MQIDNEYVQGKVILIDKPLEWTSFDVVKKIRYNLSKLIGVKKLKVGHAGTLDPLASGLLIVCTGKKTKTISEIQNQSKKYEGIICLGSTTPSFDLETELEFQSSIDHLNEEVLNKALKSFVGKIRQVPPIFSAKKINGKRAYLHARKGDEIELKENQIEIYSFELSKIELPDVHFQIHCSKGTYIRSIANDYGNLLGVGGYLKELRRTAIGDYSVENADTVEGWLTKIR